MKRIKLFGSIILLAIWSACCVGQGKPGVRIVPAIISDYRNFYSWENIGKLALGLGYSAFYANTSFDREIQNLYNDYIRTRTTDEMAKIFKPFGNGRITVPFYLTAVAVGELLPNSTLANTIGSYGRQTARALIVGVPLVLALQAATGASRPYESMNSRWRFFKDDNGVSGHSFMGAVPFLIAARMADQRLLKYPLFLGSILTGFSRINDNQHYFSQAFLGWWIAWLATDAIGTRQTALACTGNGMRVLIYF